MFWIPGEVPIEMERFSQAARKKYELRAYFGIGSENPSVERALCENKAFVLSGFNLVYFKKESVLTVMGTILTYGQLLYKRKFSNKIKFIPEAVSSNTSLIKSSDCDRPVLLQIPGKLSIKFR
ncbi:uncharacterized protein TNCV_2507151 [Trichonephila clavipes]|nr:uncharacterized protein TNCV_2507151 [Trichonephila clavipes]